MRAFLPICLVRADYSARAASIASGARALIIDHARTPHDRKVFEFLLAPQEMGRPFFAPPGLPPERVTALRAAFERSLNDPAYLGEAERMGIEVQHRSGQSIDRLLQQVYATPKDIVDRARQVSQ